MEFLRPEIEKKNFYESKETILLDGISNLKKKKQNFQKELKIYEANYEKRLAEEKKILENIKQISNKSIILNQEISDLKNNSLEIEEHIKMYMKDEGNSSKLFSNFQEITLILKNLTSKNEFTQVNF